MVHLVACYAFLQIANSFDMSSPRLAHPSRAKPQGMPATGADGVARYGNDETRPPTRLSGGLFNQLWALQGLVMDAYESKLPLTLPSWDSHLFPASMGLEKDARFKRPLQLPFAALWRKDVFTNTLRKHGVVAVASNDSWQAANAVASTSTAAMRRYMRYMIRRANGTENAHPLEDVVYRALLPAPHLARRVERLLRRLRLISAGSTFGCLHARVERDMQRWWYHVAKARPPTMRQILDAIGSEARMQRSRAIYVCVGSDLKPRDREVLGNRTSWGAALLRRPTLLAEDAEDEAAARAGSSEHSKEDDGRYVRVGSSQRRASCTQVLTTAPILSSPQVLLHPWERCGACKCSPRRVSSLPHRYSIPGSGVVHASAHHGADPLFPTGSTPSLGAVWCMQVLTTARVLSSPQVLHPWERGGAPKDGRARHGALVRMAARGAARGRWRPSSD